MKIKANCSELWKATQAIASATNSVDLNERCWKAREQVASAFFKQNTGPFMPIDKTYMTLDVDDDVGKLITTHLVAQRLTKDNS